MTSTPPPPGRVHTPPAPLHGPRHDTYEPYSPRRSRRISEQQSRLAAIPTAATPSKHRYTRATTPPSSARPRGKQRAPPQHTLSPPSSPSSPQQHGRSITHKTPRKSGNGSLAGDRQHLNPMALLDPTHALPTPAKTPRKMDNLGRSTFQSTARVLFQQRPATVEEAMPTPRKSRTAGKKNAGFSIGSFAEESRANRDEFEIYEDSRERIPVADDGEENPFINQKQDEITAAAPVSTPQRRADPPPRSAVKRRSARRNERVPPPDSEDGLVYVFRGKKVFRRFSDTANNNRGESSADEATPLAGSSSTTAAQRAAGAAAKRPLRRAKFTPRLLFPNDAQRAEREARDGNVVDPDEEATTEIEDGAEAVTTSNAPTSSMPATTPRKAMKTKHATATPRKNLFRSTAGPTGGNMPATPPTTVRTTRHMDFMDRNHETAMTPEPSGSSPFPAPQNDEDQDTEMNSDNSPNGPTRVSKRNGKSNSPFDTWRRSKPHTATNGTGTAKRGPSGMKRGGESINDTSDVDGNDGNGESSSRITAPPGKRSRSANLNVDLHTGTRSMKGPVTPEMRSPLDGDRMVLGTT